ncbi:hypothetical protein D3C73_972380 [compost metagenome]
MLQLVLGHLYLRSSHIDIGANASQLLPGRVGLLAGRDAFAGASGQAGSIALQLAQLRLTALQPVGSQREIGVGHAYLLFKQCAIQGEQDIALADHRAFLHRRGADRTIHRWDQCNQPAFHVDDAAGHGHLVRADGRGCGWLCRSGYILAAGTQQQCRDHGEAEGKQRRQSGHRLGSTVSFWRRSSRTVPSSMAITRSAWRIRRGSWLTHSTVA